MGGSLSRSETGRGSMVRVERISGVSVAYWTRDCAQALRVSKRTESTDHRSTRPRRRTAGTPRSARASHQGSQIAEHQIELDIAFVDRAAVHALDADETDVERVLVGADLRNAPKVAPERQPQQLSDLRGGEHQLKDAVMSGMATDLAIVAQQPKDDRQARVNGQQRSKPAFQVTLPSRRVEIEPVVIGGQIE